MVLKGLEEDLTGRPVLQPERPILQSPPATKEPKLAEPYIQVMPSRITFLPREDPPSTRLLKVRQSMGRTALKDAFQPCSKPLDSRNIASKPFDTLNRHGRALTLDGKLPQ